MRVYLASSGLCLLGAALVSEPFAAVDDDDGVDHLDEVGLPPVDRFLWLVLLFFPFPPGLSKRRAITPEPPWKIRLRRYCSDGELLRSAVPYSPSRCS